MGEGASPLIPNQLRGVSACRSARRGSEGLQVAEATGDIHIFQAEMCTPKFHAEGLGLGLEDQYFLFDGDSAHHGFSKPAGYLGMGKLGMGQGLCSATHA